MFFQRVDICRFQLQISGFSARRGGDVFVNVPQPADAVVDVVAADHLSRGVAQRLRVPDPSAGVALVVRVRFFGQFLFGDRPVRRANLNVCFRPVFADDPLDDAVPALDRLDPRGERAAADARHADRRQPVFDGVFDAGFVFETLDGRLDHRFAEHRGRRSDRDAPAQSETRSGGQRRRPQVDRVGHRRGGFADKCACFSNMIVRECYFPVSCPKIG